MAGGRKLRCKKCGDVIQSMFRHDLKWCKCQSIFVDGGSDYTHSSGDLDSIEYIDEPAPKEQKKSLLADGGLDIMMDGNPFIKFEETLNRLTPEYIAGVVKEMEKDLKVAHRLRAEDTVIVDEDEESHISGLKSKLYNVDDEYGYIDFDNKSWKVPFLDLQLVCTKHPRYKAIKKPTSNCETCWRIWDMKEES